MVHNFHSYHVCLFSSRESRSRDSFIIRVRFFLSALTWLHPSHHLYSRVRSSLSIKKDTMNVRKLRDVPRYRKTFIYRVDTWFELCFYRHRFLRPWRFIVLSHVYTYIYISLFFSLFLLSIYSLTVHEHSYDFFPTRRREILSREVFVQWNWREPRRLHSFC